MQSRLRRILLGTSVIAEKTIYNLFEVEEINMAKLVECIPNFSLSKEKDPAGYEALVQVAKSVPGCTLFDAQTDGNHNRSVFTMIGSPYLHAYRT